LISDKGSLVIWKDHGWVYLVNDFKIFFKKKIKKKMNKLIKLFVRKKINKVVWQYVKMNLTFVGKKKKKWKPNVATFLFYCYLTKFT
jgi:hypothetical protein